MPSTYLYNPSTNQSITFSGVTSLRHNLSLKLSTETDPTAASDLITAAKNEPTKLTLSISESDTSSDPAVLFSSLISLKESRTLLQLITPLRTWANLLLSDLTITRDDKTPFGFTGTLTLQETTVPTSSPTTGGSTSAGSTTTIGPTANNTSTASHQGISAPVPTTASHIVTVLNNGVPISVSPSGVKITVLK